MEAEQKKKSGKEILKELVKRDFLYIVVILIALIGCLYTLLNVGDYQAKCNQHWQEQIESNCDCRQITMFTQNHTLIGTNIEIPTEKYINNNTPIIPEVDVK